MRGGEETRASLFPSPPPKHQRRGEERRGEERRAFPLETVCQV